MSDCCNRCGLPGTRFVTHMCMTAERPNLDLLLRDQPVIVPASEIASAPTEIVYGDFRSFSFVIE